jgi:hypothetical protein
MHIVVMNRALLVLFLIISKLVYAQGESANFSRIDWAVQTIDAATPEQLAHKLTVPYTTDREKVRSIFRWITEHIAYAVRPRTAVSRSAAVRFRPASMDSLLALKTVDEIVAYTVMQNRTAVCNGYARLFKALCLYAGIRAEMVTGYARGSFGNPAFRPNHSWNAVYVDSAWRLLDVTWASGYVSFTEEFVRHYDDSYFFPDPEQFIRSHYPEDLRWALLQNPPTLHEFNNMPFRLTAFTKYGISGYAPSRGVVEATIGDTVQFRLQVRTGTGLAMAPELNADSMLQSNIPNWAFLRPDVTGAEIVYTFPVHSEAIEWIHLVYNGDVILRYRLNIRKPRL